MKKTLFILLPVLAMAGNYVLKKAEISPTRIKMVSAEYVLQGTIQSGIILKRVYSSEGPQSGQHMNIPIAYALNIFPNPFTKQTRINYALPRQTSVKIMIYDVIGRKVKTLVSDMLNPGYYSTIWDGTGDIERKASSGIYFIRFEADKFESQDKILFVK